MTDDTHIVLMQAGILTPDSSRRIKEFTERWKVSALKAVLECHIVDEHTLADALAETLSIQRLYHLDSAIIEMDALSSIPYDDAKELEIMPIMYLDEYRKELEVVLVDPFCRKVESYLKDKLDCGFRRVLGSRSDVLKAIDQYYPVSSQIDFKSKESRRGCDHD